MDKYIYDGPVVAFNKCVTNNWHGETLAVSRYKAICNLKYQFKKQNNQIPGTKIELPGKIVLVK